MSRQSLTRPPSNASFIKQWRPRAYAVPTPGSICLAALTIAAEGGKADIAKPMHGMGAAVFEIALPFRGDAFRVVYALQLAEEI
jgi:hypothetical protein